MKEKVQFVAAAVLVAVFSIAFVSSAFADYPGYPVSDWAHEGNRSEIAAAIINTWRYAGESVREEYMATGSLIGVIKVYIDNYSKNTSIFEVACDAVGVDFNKYL